jgi:Protein of unknown function (DUF2537)
VDTVELRAERGQVVLIGAPELFEPPTALADALDEWAEVAAAICADGEIDPVTAELVSARGRQLAARLAAAAGITVRYTDPMRGVLERVSAAQPRRTPEAGVSLGAGTSPEAAEPTPWATGLTVTAFAAVVVLFAVASLVRGLGEMAWWLGAAGLIVVTAGLAPSVWLTRHTPLWRWVSYGVAGGLGLSWVIALLSTLGP